MQTQEFCRKTVKIARTKQTEKKARNTDLTSFDNCLCPGAEGESSYSTQSIQVIINGDNTLLYIGREPTKKKKPKALNSDQK